MRVATSTCGVLACVGLLPQPRPQPGRGTLGADALQQHRRRFVVRILGHELPGERLLEDALAQSLGSLQSSVNGSFGLLNNR